MQTEQLKEITLHSAVLVFVCALLIIACILPHPHAPALPIKVCYIKANEYASQQPTNPHNEQHYSRYRVSANRL